MKIMTRSFVTTAMALSCLLTYNSGKAQEVGIGTVMPDYQLHVASTSPSLLKLENSTALGTDIRSDLFFKTGGYYTGAIKTIGTGINLARLGLFTFASGTSTSLQERLSILDNGYVGIGIANPNFLLDVDGRMRIRNDGNTSGLWLTNAANTVNAAFIGMYSDTYVGFYGGTGFGWGLVMNTTNGRIGIGTPSPSNTLEVHGDESAAGYFENTSGGNLTFGVSAYNNSSAGNGYGVRGEGGKAGVWGVGTQSGAGNRYGVEGYATDGDGTNFGVHGTATTGVLAIGIYGTASGATTNWGGYFAGNVYTTGTYQPSDRRLKNEIQPLSDAMKLINQLKPSVYKYKTIEYKQLQLPEGNQYGLIADEVMQVVPGAVKKTIQPAEYENQDEINGKKLSDAVEFNSINYIEFIPILIGAIQEQQKRIDELEKKLASLEKD